MREHDYEPVPGLPERLPAGERILWQGAPKWRVLARRAFHADKVALYFALLLGWRAAVVATGNAPVSDLAAGAVWLVPMGVVASGILVLFAWLHARAALYTVTNRRVVVRFGVVLPMTVNLPFTAIRDVHLKTHSDGTGDLALELGGDKRVAYFHLWPHVRRWHFANPQPMLRAVAHPTEVGERLVDALRAFDRTERNDAPTVESATAETRRPDHHLAAAG